MESALEVKEHPLGTWIIISEYPVMFSIIEFIYGKLWFKNFS